MRILIVDPGYEYSTLALSESYYRAFVKLGYEVMEHDTLEMMKIYNSGRRSMGKPPILGELSQFVFSPIVADVITYKIDAVLVVHGFFMHPTIVNVLRQIGCKTGLILTDDPMQIDVSKNYSRFYDYIFTNEKNCMEKHGKRCHYIPVAVDEDIFNPKAYSEKYKSDILISGSLYLERKLFIENSEELKKVLKKHNTKIVGARKIEFNDPELNAMFGPDKISYEEMAKWTASAKVTIDIPRNEFLFTQFGESNKSFIRASYINPRIFECATSKSFVMTSDERSEIDELFPKDLIFKYTSAEHLAGWLDFYTSNYLDNRHRVGEIYDYCIANHTYVHRAKKIAEIMDLSPSIKEISYVSLIDDQIIEKLDNDWKKNFNILSRKGIYTSERSLEKLKDKKIFCKEIDIISNGPSYEDTEDELYDEDRKTIKMCVNEAVDFYNTVDPYSFCVILHPTDDLYERCFKNFDVPRKLILISSTLANHRVIEKWLKKSEQIYFYNPGPGVEIKDEVIKLTGYPSFGAGFSVAYSAIASAIYIGWKKINLFGFDFCFMKNKKYAFKDFEFKKIDRDRVFLTKDAFNRPVLTDTNYIVARNCIFRLIEDYKDIEFNVYGGGMLYSERLKNLKVVK